MAILIENLTKRYVAPDGSSVPVIDIADFSLRDGEQVALIGTSGSGKTTLLHMIAGILRPDTGRIVFADDGAPLADAPQTGSTLPYASPPMGVDVASLSEAQRDIFRGKNIGYIFQTHHLLPGFTAMENVLLGMSFTGRKSDPKWARHLLNEVGLSDRLDYKPEKLSVGQQQRVAVARALANRPKLVLAYEPTGALDSKERAQVLELIRSLCREVVMRPLLLVTHDLEIAKKLERTVVLSEINRAASNRIT